MPQGSDFIFALQDENYNFWSFDSNGNPKLGTRPYFMQFAPDGWNEIVIQNLRNKLYKAIDRSISVPLNYVVDGSMILKHIAYQIGLKEKVFLTIAGQQLNYAPFPEGILAFTSGSENFAPNSTNDGTITGTPGKTVYVKMNITNPDISDSVVGFFDTVNVNFNYLNPNPTYAVVIPPSGIINFSIHFTQVGSSTSTAGMVLVNSSGSTSGSYGYWYKLVYRGEVDWATYSHSGTKVTCQTLEDGLPKYLKASDKTVYEFPMNVPEAIYYKADGIILHNFVENLVEDGVSSDPNYAMGNHLVNLLITKEDAPYVDGKKSVPRTKVSNSNAAIKATQGWFVTTNTTGVVEIEYDFKIRVSFYPPPGINPAGLYFVSVRKINLAGAGTNMHNLLQLTASQVSIGGGHEWHLQGSANINMDPGDELYLYSFFTTQGPTGDVQIETLYLDDPISFFNYKYKFRPATTFIRAFRPQYLFEQLISKLTEGTYTAALSAFFYNHRTKVLTCGNALRGLEEAVMKISFDIFFKIFDSLFSVGIVDRNNKTVDFAEEHNLIDFADTIDLPAPAIQSLKIYINKELLVNEVKMGFPDIKNEVGVLNGNQEFNVGSLWSTNATTLTGRLDKTNPAKFSPYEMEQVRLATFQKDSTDYKNDNEIYGAHIGDVLIPATTTTPEHYILDRSLNLLVTDGLIEIDTIYNIWFSPARSFERNGLHIHGRFYKSDAETFFFRSSDRNKELVCDGVTEKANINIGTLTQAIATPWMFDFEVPPPEDIISLLDLNPLQAFTFPFEGNIYKGLLEKISIAPSSKKEQQMTLRSAASNDMTKLKQYNG